MENENTTFSVLLNQERPLKVKKALDALHRKWKEMYPLYPEERTVSQAALVRDSSLKSRRHIVQYDVVIYKNTYLFSIVMEDNLSSNCCIRSNVLPDDYLSMVISNTVGERCRRFYVMRTLLITYIQSISTFSILEDKCNLIYAATVLLEATKRIRTNYRYLYAKNEVIEKHFADYLVDHMELTSASIQDFTQVFWDATKNESWLIPEPNLEEDF